MNARLSRLLPLLCAAVRVSDNRFVVANMGPEAGLLKTIDQQGNFLTEIEFILIPGGSVSLRVMRWTVRKGRGSVASGPVPATSWNSLPRTLSSSQFPDVLRRVGDAC